MTVLLTEFTVYDPDFTARLDRVVKDHGIEIQGIYDPFIGTEKDHAYVTVPIEDVSDLMMQGEAERPEMLRAALRWNLRDAAAELEDAVRNVFARARVNVRTYAEQV